jgi:hypothetical protein
MFEVLFSPCKAVDLVFHLKNDGALCYDHERMMTLRAYLNEEVICTAPYYLM